MSTTTSSSSSNVHHQRHYHHHGFGNTTHTKVFVGGLAWETPTDSLREHFQQYGDILEAVIISDKLSGRSKGYGFVTFREAEAAAKACEDAAPVINGRKANCNLASLGAKREKPALLPSPSPSPPPQLKIVTISQQQTSTDSNNYMTNGGQVRWYYPAGATPYQSLHQQVPYYAFSPAYYNQKLRVYSSGFYNNGQMYPIVTGHQMVPMYPFYPQNNQSMSFPGQFFPAIHHPIVPKIATFAPPIPGAMTGV